MRATPALLLTACLPNLDVDLSTVDRPRVLAITATPAEAAPNETFTVEALLADESGRLDGAELGWSLCTARRPLAELGPVSRDCITGDNDALLGLGLGGSIEATMPMEACRRYGPEPPGNTEGTSNGRPVDPDATGGYAQPVILKGNGLSPRTSLFGMRLACGLAGATQQQSAEFNMRYRPNAAPAIDVVQVKVDGGAATIVDPTQPIVVGTGADVELDVGWPTCPALCTDDCATAVDCTGAEPYLYFDPISLQLRERGEAMSLAWYATAGSFDNERTGRDEGEPTWDWNVWTAPDEARDVVLWIVIRDDRGGVTWTELHVTVG